MSLESIIKQDRFIGIPAADPRWLRLDNTATIFPFTMSKNYASMFQLSVTLRENIDPEMLKTALDATAKRVPSFRCRLRHGLFWHYFDVMEGAPEIEEDVRNPLIKTNWNSGKHFLFRVRYYERRISLEVFHALSDGTGAMVFLLSLVAEYLRLHDGYKPETSDWILPTSEAPKKTEYEDAFFKFARTTSSLTVGHGAAYHIHGTAEENDYIDIITGRIPVAPLKSEAAKYGCTITAYLAAVTIYALQQIQKKDHPKRKRPIVVTIPVNLRRWYPSKTLRNFFACIDVGIDSSLGEYSFEEIVGQVRSEMAMKLTEKHLNQKFSANTRLAKNRFLRCIPLFVKRPILLFGNWLFGDRNATTTLSNLGNIVLPLKLSEYVERIDCVNGRHRGKASTCVCVSYNGMLSVSFSRKIKETDFERLFFTWLVEKGITVEIESNLRK